MNRVKDDAKKAYEVYRYVMQKKYTDVNTAELNVLYNILCRIKRDKSYASEIENLRNNEESLYINIEKYFADYNNLYGLDIKEMLTEFENPDFVDGAFFVLHSFKKHTDGSLTKCAPTEYLKDDVAHIKAILLSCSSKSPITVDKISCVAICEDGKIETVAVNNASEIDLSLTLSREGEIRFEIVAQNNDGKDIPGFEKARGGIIFSKDEIMPTHKLPEDFVEFWRLEIDRMFRVDPTSKSSDGYYGNVQFLHNIPQKNFYKLLPVNYEYLGDMRAKALTTLEDSDLDRFDVWDVTIKSPGPCPATAYISVPRFANPKSVPMKFIFDGYGVRCPAPMIEDEYIVVHCSHHGYELGQDDKNYYEPLRKGICAGYGSANGKPNSDYDDIHDCYMTYLNLRNLQMLRFCTDQTISQDLPLIHKKWNGEVIFEGGSMGGYQAICIGALSTLFDKAQFKVARIVSNITAFCNLAGHTDDRIKTVLTNYVDGCDYFDAALLATLIKAPVIIPRAGLGDEVCPVSGILAMFNSIPKDVKKEINFLQNSSHGYLPPEEYQDWYKYNC